MYFVSLNINTEMSEYPLFPCLYLSLSNLPEDPFTENVDNLGDVLVLSF